MAGSMLSFLDRIDIPNEDFNFKFLNDNENVLGFFADPDLDGVFVAEWTSRESLSETAVLDADCESEFFLFPKSSWCDEE